MTEKQNVLDRKGQGQKRSGYGFLLSLLVFALLSPVSKVHSESIAQPRPVDWAMRILDWNNGEDYGFTLLSAQPLSNESYRQSLRLERYAWNDTLHRFQIVQTNEQIALCGATAFQKSTLVDFFDASPDFAFVALRTVSLPKTVEQILGIERLLFLKVAKTDNSVEVLNCPLRND